MSFFVQITILMTYTAKNFLQRDEAYFVAALPFNHLSPSSSCQCCLYRRNYFPILYGRQTIFGLFMAIAFTNLLKIHVNKFHHYPSLFGEPSMRPPFHMRDKPLQMVCLKNSPATEPQCSVTHVVWRNFISHVSSFHFSKLNLCPSLCN